MYLTERLEEEDSFVPVMSLGGYLASSTVKRKSPPEFNPSGVISGGLFGGRGIAVARNLMASVSISRARERSRTNLHLSPDTTLPSSWFRLARPSATPAASGSAKGNRTLVSHETPDHQLPQVALFEYSWDYALICGGSVSNGQRVCVTHPGMCTFKHTPKLHTQLADGFYIRPAVGRGGASIYLSPTVSASTVSASLGFFSIRDTSTCLATMNRLFMAANDGSLDNASPQDIKAVIGMKDDEPAPNSKTPCKRAKLVDTDYGDHHEPLGEDTSPTSSHWKTAEHEFA